MKVTTPSLRMQTRNRLESGLTTSGKRRRDETISKRIISVVDSNNIEHECKV